MLRFRYPFTKLALETSNSVAKVGLIFFHLLLFFQLDTSMFDGESKKQNPCARDNEDVRIRSERTRCFSKPQGTRFATRQSMLCLCVALFRKLDFPTINH